MACSRKTCAKTSYPFKDDNTGAASALAQELKEGKFGDEIAADCGGGEI